MPLIEFLAVRIQPDKVHFETQRWAGAAFRPDAGIALSPVSKADFKSTDEFWLVRSPIRAAAVGSSRRKNLSEDKPGLYALLSSPAGFSNTWNAPAR